MIPRALARQLWRLRCRERILELTWGAARWLAQAVALLLVAALIDWTPDARHARIATPITLLFSGWGGVHHRLLLGSLAPAQEALRRRACFAR
jgi:hypothetical protein